MRDTVQSRARFVVDNTTYQGATCVSVAAIIASRARE